MTTIAFDVHPQSITSRCKIVFSEQKFACLTSEHHSVYRPMLNTVLSSVLFGNFIIEWRLN